MENETLHVGADAVHALPGDLRIAAKSGSGQVKVYQTANPSSGSGIKKLTFAPHSNASTRPSFNKLTLAPPPTSPAGSGFKQLIPHTGESPAVIELSDSSPEKEGSAKKCVTLPSV